jgi:fibronectin-binding autotransporter adhesin
MYFASLRPLLNRLSILAWHSRRMSTGRPRYGLSCERLEDRLAPATITFSNAQGGAWGNPNNWDLGRLPAPGDTAVINLNGITVTYSADVSTDPTLVANLNLSGHNSFLDIQSGTLQATSALSITNAFTAIVAGGTLEGQTTFNVGNTQTGGAALTVYSGTVEAPGDNLTIQNGSTLTLNGGSLPNITTIQSGSTLTLNGGSLPNTTMVVNSTIIQEDASTTGLGTIIVYGNSALQGNISSGETVWVQGNTNFGGNATLTVSAGASNAGILQLKSTVGAWNSDLTISGNGAFTNTLDGQILVSNGTGGTRTITGNLTNQGPINVSSDTSLEITGGIYDADGGAIQGPCYVYNDQVMVTASPPGGTTINLVGKNNALLGNNLAGTTLWVQGDTNFGGNAALNMPAGATNAGILRLESTVGAWNSDLTISGNGAFTNLQSGEILVGSGTGGPRTITGELTNEGTFDINTSLTLGGISGTENHVNTDTGLISIADGATLTVRGASFVNQAGGMITGSGKCTIDITQANLENDGTIQVLVGSTLTVKGTTFRNFNPTLNTLTGGSYRVAGIFRFDAASITTLSADIQLTQSGAQINNQTGTNALANLATITDTGSLSLTNITFPATGGLASLANDGTLNVMTGATLTVSGTYSQSGTLDINQGTLDLKGTFANFDATTGTLTRGTFIIAGTTAMPGSLVFPNANLGTNAANLTFDGPGAQIVNGTSNAKVSLTNLAANTGSLSAEDGFNPTVGAFTDSGTLTMGAGSTFTANGAYTEAGMLIVLAGGTLNAASSLSNFSGGTLTGGSYFIGGTFQFAGAAIAANDATIVLDGSASQIVDESGHNALAGFTTNAGSFTIQNGRSLTTAGDFSNAGSLTVGDGSTLTVSGAYMQAGTLSISDSGTVDLLGGGSANGNLNNAGTLIIDVGSTFTVTDPVALSGTVNVQSGAMLTLADGSSNSGTLNVLGTVTANGDLSNSGSMSIAGTVAVSADFSNGGSVDLLNGGSFTTGGGYTQMDGSTTLSNATLSASGLVDIQGGTLSGSGTINASLQNAAVIQVGQSGAPGSLTVTGDYTQTASGVLDIDIGGYIPGTNYDQLAIGGQATLDGTLNVTLINGFTPNPGDSFTIMTFAGSSGGFATTNLPSGGTLNISDGMLSF